MSTFIATRQFQSANRLLTLNGLLKTGLQRFRCKPALLLLLTFLLTQGAFSQSTAVKISQVYSGGGGSTGSYLRDYVELYNTSCSPVDIGGWCIAYGSATGNYGSSTANVFTFPAGTTIGPKKYLLIECGGLGTAGTVLPVTADFATATTGFSMSGTAGKVGLFNTSPFNNVPCSSLVATTVVDKFSWGTTANCAEGTAKTAPTTAQVMVRNLNGETDSNDNNSDFTNTATSSAPPRNSSSPANPGCAGSAPTVQVTGITFSNPTASTVDVSWTNGNGDGRIVKINTNPTITSPVAGSSYTGTAAYSGSGEQVVYSGNGNSVTITGLAPGQTYHLQGFEYSNTGLLYNTNTSSGNPNNTSLSYPAPTATSLAPPSATEGGAAFTLTVTGNGFFNASTINWNGTAKPTTYVNATTLTAPIDAADIATAGTATVSVTNPAPGGGTSGNLTFIINAANAPVISVTGSLSNFITTAGQPSAAQSYSVSGVNMTDNITVTPPAGFEIRTGANAFATTPLLITQSGGIIPATTVDVRFNPGVTGTFSGNITHSSTGAQQQDLPVSGYSTEAEPVLNSSVSFGTITGSSIEVLTTGGNGTSRIIVARANSAGTYAPADGAAVTGANANFSLATLLSDSSRIVYDGTGNNVIVTGLTASTTYHFTVFEYNGSGATSNYLVAGAGTASATTISAEPSTASTLLVTRVKTDTTFVSFTGGNGSGRMVVISTNPVSFTPNDGITYAGADSNITSATDLGGGNFLLFNGATPKTSLRIAGLAAGTVYYVRSYEYNGSGSSINYRTSTFGTDTLETPNFLAYTGGTYQQNFNGLPTSGTFSMSGFGLGPYYLSTPPVNAMTLTGWQHASIAGSGADLLFSVDNGGSTNSGTKSYGTTGSTNRALGALAGTSFTSTFGAVLVNNSGGPLSKVSISYTGSQWRNGGSGTPNILAFSYQLGSTGILGSGFNSETLLNFQSPVSSPTSGALDGTLNTNRNTVSASFTLNGTWQPGQTLVIRWVDNNDAGSDDALAIDDFTFLAEAPSTPLQQDSLLTFSNVLTTSMNVNWTNGDATDRIVVMNTSNSFTPPVDGTTYTANTVYTGSGEQVVYNGSGSTVSISGLTAGTTYWFRVYAYNGSGSLTKYNTATAQDNPLSQSTAAPTAATRLVILSVNGGSDPADNLPFSVTVQAQDSAGNPQNVNIATTISLSVLTGFGALGGNTTGILTAGSNTVTISGLTYTPEDFGVELLAEAISGETLDADTSAPFNVLGVATQLAFGITPTAGIVNSPIPSFQVFAYRNDFTVDVNFNGTVTLSKFSGPGNLGGTLTAACTAGVATFNNVTFDTPGSYELEATATGLTNGYSTAVYITLAPVITELVVPKYISGKSSLTSGSHNSRVPIAVCLKIENLVPNSAYDVRAGLGLTGDSTTTYGSGNTWLGTAYGFGNITNAFTTDANGSSGPFWIYLQPTASSTNARFTADSLHNLRIGFVQSGGVMPTTPNYIGTKLIRALDVGNTSTASTADDGAFIKGSSVTCLSGKYILVYDNEAGTGDPLYAYQARQMTPTNGAQTELPSAIGDVLSQGGSSAIGDYVALIPTGANNPNGVRRIEARNADNTLFNATTDADGIWAGSINTTNLTRRGIATLGAGDAVLNTLSFTTSSTPESCTGNLDGTATVNVITGTQPVFVTWSNGATTNTVNNLASGVYTVLVSDQSGCSRIDTVTVGVAGSAAVITPGGPTTFCNGGSVTLSAGAGNSYLWSTGETTQSITASTTGSYVVTVASGSCNATSLPVSVTVTNYSFSGTIFSENMGVPTANTNVNTYTGWQNTAPITFSNNATSTDVRTTTPSSSYSGSSGGGNVFFGTTGGNLKQFIISGINTAGMSNLVLSFGLLRSDLTNSMSVEVSSDGINYDLLITPQPTLANSWQLITPSGSIPATSNLRIRFTKNATTSFRLDDVKLTSSTSTVAVSANGPTSVCGAGSVILSSNVPSGIVWSTGATTRSITVNSNGNYSFVATDANGCTAAAPALIFTVNPEPTASATFTPVLCAGDSSTVTVSATGGIDPYNGTGTFTVPAGTYNYIVADANGCDDTVLVVITQPAALSATSTAGTITCNGGNTTVNVSALGGTAPYTGTGAFTSGAGNYSYVVTDANGCQATTTGTITQPNALTITSFTPTSGLEGTVVQITGTGFTGTTSVTFNGISAVFTLDADSQLTATAPAGVSTGSIVITAGSCGSVTSTTPFSVNTNLTLNVTFIIQGFYDGVTGMTPVLANNLIPGVGPDEVDTVLIELRDVNNTATTVFGASVVVNSAGLASLSVPGSLTGGSHYIAISHRNAVQTWSAAPVALTSGTTSYNFTTAAAQAYGDNQIEMSPGVFAFYSGDLAPQDGVVDIFDQVPLDNDINNFGGGYLVTELNGDGVVDLFDQVIMDNNIANFIGTAQPF